MAVPRRGRPRAAGAAQLLLLVVLAAARARPAAGLRFFLAARERACFGVSARAGGLLRGFVALENGKGSAKVALEIAGPDNAVIYERHDAAIGSFSVTTPGAAGKDADDGDWDDDDEAVGGLYGMEKKYKACLVLTMEQQPDPTVLVRRAVVFRLYAAERGEDGAAASGGGAVSDKKVDDMAGALKTMMGEMQAMVGDLSTLQRRESGLVRKQDENARRLGQLTALSIAVLVLTSVFQYSHYKAFFTSKKLC
jgi:hypothetical protein